MSEKPHSNTPQSSEAGDSSLPSTYVDDVFDLASSLSKSQLNGESKNTYGAEAPQAASAEKPQSIANPTEGNTSLAHIKGPEFMEFYDTDAASRRGTGAVEKETTSTAANTTQGHTLPALIIGPDVMQPYNMKAASEHVTGADEKKSSEEIEDTTSTPASSLLGPGSFNTNL